MTLATWVLAALLAQAPVPAETPTPVPPALSEIERLRVENHALKLRLAQLETQLRTRELTDERAAVDAALRAAYPGWHMDWTTGALVPDAAEEPEG
jgi:hypothetical protein